MDKFAHFQIETMYLNQSFEIQVMLKLILNAVLISVKKIRAVGRVRRKVASFMMQWLQIDSPGKISIDEVLDFSWVESATFDALQLATNQNEAIFLLNR